jgi:hypothetical protein
MQYLTYTFLFLENTLGAGITIDTGFFMCVPKCLLKFIEFRRARGRKLNKGMPLMLMTGKIYSTTVSKKTEQKIGLQN